MSAENNYDAPPALDWPKRKHIALGAARGLSYLHEHCDPKIIHRDVKVCADFHTSNQIVCILASFPPSINWFVLCSSHANCSSGRIYYFLGYPCPLPY